MKKSIKVFISYSHKDEEHKEALNEHLAMLKRNNIIDTWHDRKISPGQDWSKEISKNLEQSELILFLISPSFLSSDYCFNLEMKRAMEMHKEGKTQIIPILIRACDWSESELSAFQAVPKDAKPITSWSNHDEAWLDAIKGIRQHISTFNPIQTSTALTETHSELAASDAILEWTEDTEIIFTHSRATKLKLSDIYISLDMELEKVTDSKDVDIANSEILYKKPNRYLVFGDEQQGKTSLLKHAYVEFLKLKYIPIYLDAKEINQSDIKKYLVAAVKNQYSHLELNDFLAISNKVLLLDNFDEISLNTKYKSSFIDSINEVFTTVIVTCHSSFRYISPEIQELNNYESYELLGLGHVKRSELIEKWVSFGIEESIEEHELFDKCDDIKARLDTVIRKNIVPSKPIYILMLLQMFEAYSQQNLELSSHGHCYQQLIYQAFDHAKIPKNEFDRYINVLTELAWVLHKNSGALNQHQLENFFKEYEQTYLPVDSVKVINKLKSNSILVEKNFNIQFKYPYLFYFFAAKKIAESFSTNKSVQDEVKKLVSALHREDYANILVFVTHHTKEAWVLEEIQSSLNLLFVDQVPATLSKDQLGFMDEFIAKIPELVMEQRVIRDERLKRNQNLETMDKEDLSNEEPDDILANINKVFKGMEISGQIIRNRHATLTREAMFDLASNGVFTGLRFLNFFIHISDIAKSEVIKFIEQKLKEHPNLTNDEVQDFAKNTFLLMTYGVINGTIRKIASSIGSKEATEIYASIQKENQSPALILLNQAIELHFKRNLEIQSVTATSEKIKNNPVCTRILKEMIIQHTYMFPVDYKEKQQLSELLNLSVKGQRLLDREKRTKA